MSPAPTFRLMPNTPVEVRRGVILYTPAGEVDGGLEREVLGMFERLGSVVTVPERLAAAAAAVMSVRPGVPSAAGRSPGRRGRAPWVAPALASRLVAETMSGTAALLQVRDYDTLAVRREVTSPGGSTARGLDALERGGVRAAFQAAIDGVCGEPAR